VTASLREQLADLAKAEAARRILASMAPNGSARLCKTRCGAEWVAAEVQGGRRRIALVGPTAADARDCESASNPNEFGT
jgi:phage terminase large subunit-like protein